MKSSLSTKEQEKRAADQGTSACFPRLFMDGSGIHDGDLAVFRYPFSEVFTNGSPDGAFRLRRADAGGELTEDALPAQGFLEFPIAVRRQDERVMQGIPALHDLTRDLAAPHGFVPERPFVFCRANRVDVICCHKIPP